MPISQTYQVADSLMLEDTLYGVKNEESIPVRSAPVITTEEYSVKQFNPSPIVNTVENWQIIILITIIFLLAFVKAFSSNRFKQGIRALHNYGVAQEITREEKVFFHRSNMFLTIIHLVTAALFLYEVRDYIVFSGVEQNGYIFFLLMLGVLTVMYIVKYVFSKVLLFVFDDASIAPEYIFNVSLYNNLLGVLLIPVLCVTYFTSIPFLLVLLYLVLPISFLTLFLRIFRMSVIGMLKGISYFYIFVYICTLEILPLVVLYRIFIHK